MEPVGSSKLILQVKIFKLTLYSQIQNIFIESYSSESHSLIKGVSRCGLQSRSSSLLKMQFFGSTKNYRTGNPIWGNLGFSDASMVKNLPAIKTWFRSLGQEDPLEKEMAIYSSILAWRIPWTEEPGGLQSMEPQRFGHSWVTNTHILVVQWLRLCASNAGG